MIGASNSERVRIIVQILAPMKRCGKVVEFDKNITKCREFLKKVRIEGKNEERPVLKGIFCIRL